ncbi:MAG: hypothetical protein M1812_007470 [Candelaria pacifica]|nr:MAG: hypothetical protein M1812_007470 [Candelaria pacifica]
MTRSSPSLVVFSLLHLLLLSYVPLATSTALRKTLESAQLVKRGPAEIYCPAPLPPHTPPGSSPSEHVSITYPSRFPVSIYNTLDDLCWARTTGKSPNVVVANAGCECVYVDHVGWRVQCFSPPGAEELTHNDPIRTYCIFNCECWTEEDQEDPQATEQTVATTSGSTNPNQMKYRINVVVDWDAVCASQGKSPEKSPEEGAREGFQALPFNERRLETAYCSLAETGGCCQGEKCAPVGEVSGPGILEVLMGVVISVGLNGVGSCVAAS